MQEYTEENLWTMLPDEICVQIISFITNLNDIKNLMLSNRLLNQLANDNKVWRSICRYTKKKSSKNYLKHKKKFNREKWKGKENYQLNQTNVKKPKKIKKNSTEISFNFLFFKK